MDQLDRPAGCHHWIGTSNRYCGMNPTRRYLTGDRCNDHAPDSRDPNRTAT